MMEGSSMGYLDLPYTQEPVVFPRITHISEVKPSRESHAVISRQKRNILFPSGVKLCVQETAEQVIANHLSYFHLRGKTQCESVLKMNIVNGVSLSLSHQCVKMAPKRTNKLILRDCPLCIFPFACLQCEKI